MDEMGATSCKPEAAMWMLGWKNCGTFVENDPRTSKNGSGVEMSKTKIVICSFCRQKVQSFFLSGFYFEQYFLFLGSMLGIMSDKHWGFFMS